jgi:hypothetical protein
MEKQQKINKSIVDILDPEEDKEYRDKIWSLAIDEFYALDTIYYEIEVTKVLSQIILARPTVVFPILPKT